MQKLTITISKGNVIKLYNLLTEAKGSFNKNYLEFIIRNKKILESEKEVFDEMFKETPEQEEYIKEEYMLMDKYAIKNNNGQIKFPVIIKKEFVDDFNKGIETLKETKKEVFDSIIKKENEKGIALSEEVQLEIYQIPFEKLPDTISTDLYEMLRNNNFVELSDFE